MPVSINCTVPTNLNATNCQSDWSVCSFAGKLTDSGGGKDILYYLLRENSRWYHKSVEGEDKVYVLGEGCEIYRSEVCNSHNLEFIKMFVKLSFP